MSNNSDRFSQRQEERHELDCSVPFKFELNTLFRKAGSWCICAAVVIITSNLQRRTATVSRPFVRLSVLLSVTLRYHGHTTSVGFLQK